jgi:hypothetical protein
MDPVTIVTIATTLFGAWQSWQAKKYKDATSVLIDSVEAAAVSNNPKHEVAIRAVGKIAGGVIDSMLEKKSLRKRKAASKADSIARAKLLP